MLNTKNRQNNHRIAKNTFLIYLRMILVMGVSLYTSRIVLNTLGVVDFGIYNIVGGLVVLFSFLNTAMSSATQRFLSYELGKDSVDGVKQVFSMSMTAHISIVFLVVLLAESFGLLMLNTQLKIPVDRFVAANWVYQFTVISFCFQIIRVPYYASIIAYEKFNLYAYLSILEVCLKLATVIMLVFVGYDKLILYAALTCGVMFVNLILYKICCTRLFTTCSYRYFWNASLYKRLMSFSGWSLFGGIANVAAQQGLNILLNIFWGVAVNAAMGIANQVSSAVYGFVASFQTAFNPQIIKSYASNDKKYFMGLIFQTSKFSYFLLLLLSLPLLISTESFLKIWLYIVPDYAVAFCRLTIIFLLIDALSAPLWMSVQATGKIRQYQLLMGALIFINFPTAYLFLKLGFSPHTALVVRVIINLITFIVRIFYLRTHICLPVKRYIDEVLVVVVLVTVLCVPLPLVVNYYITSYIGLISVTLSAILTTGLSVYMVGLKKDERCYINSLIMSKIKTKKWQR